MELDDFAEHLVGVSCAKSLHQLANYVALCALHATFIEFLELFDLVLQCIRSLCSILGLQFELLVIRLDLCHLLLMQVLHLLDLLVKVVCICLHLIQGRLRL